jgi:uncharacterized protein with von Willebrand factor type A (vWA) domain
MNPHQAGARSLGMMVAAPHIDRLVSGHNLRSLEAFALSLPELS